MKKLTIGILAHVDAGKTTLSEALLFLAGKIRRLGRVDHKDTFLDTNAVERERGITIFSKQARFSSRECDFILLDTPGHVDFSAETERTLSLLDYAVLVISAPDGVQNHTKTLWQLLEYYKIPTFIFVNKTDIAVRDHEEIASELSKALSSHCVQYYENQTEQEFAERLTYANDDFLEYSIEGESITDEDIARAISLRKLFLCLFGSALKPQGVDLLIEALDRFTQSPLYDTQSFGAKVYKISRQGSSRLTYMKITGGVLKARDEIVYLGADGKTVSEKVTQIRLYSGDRFEQVESAAAGEIVAVLGLDQSYIGLGMGAEENSCKPVLEPVLSYGIILPKECDVRVCFPKLKELEEEEPSLHLFWNEELKQIEARLMGEIQVDLLKRMILERFGISCAFEDGKILYKEKAAGRAVGVGHFEPLKHYAEVHLLIEPLPKGSGLIFDTDVPENTLDQNWQRLILSHLYEKDHRGVITGAALTDTKITLVAGKAHLKHTEGGDFREATLRAVRQGLMKSGCDLLEPYYRFELTVPSVNVGRAANDLQNKYAEFEIGASDGENTLITGTAPVSELVGYTKDIISYTRGKGRLFCVSHGYMPCHNSEDVRLSKGYDPVSDMENTPHSVFCAHGAGFVVPWDEVDEYKHLDSDYVLQDTAQRVIPRASALAKKYQLKDEEFKAIMLRTFGPEKPRRYNESKRTVYEAKEKHKKKKPPCVREKRLIIDGYNLIYSWSYLSKYAVTDLEKAREMLIDVVANYVAFTKIKVTVVFDAYRVKHTPESRIRKDGYTVIYTKQDQTADAYIEKLMAELGPDYDIKVVTGDALVQNSAVHFGILRMTAKEFEDEITAVGNEINEYVRKLAMLK